MDFGTYLIRTIGDLLFSTPPSYETADLYKKFKEKCNSDNISKITQCVIKQMFLEKTGTHYLDSGGVFGRGWQLKQAIEDDDWMEKPSIRVEIDKYGEEYDFYVRKNTYQFLCEHLTYDIKMDKKFHEFCNTEENKKEGYYQCMRKFRDYMKEENFMLYCGENTYNGDSCLDEVLQFDILTNESEDYIILQTHNGCDVRGGYSAPHVFSLDAEEFLCMIHDLCCWCPNKNNPDKETTVQLDLNGEKAKTVGHVDCYSDDCGYHWYKNYNGKETSIIKDGGKFITDEDGEHHLVCKKCGAELEFYW